MPRPKPLPCSRRPHSCAWFSSRRVATVSTTKTTTRTTPRTTTTAKLTSEKNRCVVRAPPSRFPPEAACVVRDLVSGQLDHCRIKLRSTYQRFALFNRLGAVGSVPLGLLRQLAAIVQLWCFFVMCKAITQMHPELDRWYTWYAVVIKRSNTLIPNERTLLLHSGSRARTSPDTTRNICRMDSMLVVES